MDITVNLATPSNAPGAYEIFKQTWLATYPNEELGITAADILLKYPIEKKAETLKKYADFYQSIQNHPDKAKTLVWIAKLNDQPVGLVTIDREIPSKICALYILPQYQKQGIGKILLQTALGHINTLPVTLNVAKYNTNAIHFYEHFGFKIVGDVEDAHGHLPNGKVIPEVKMIKEN